MRILFDQGVPAPLRRALADHSVATAHEMGWTQLSNGALLRAGESQFDVFITAADENALDWRLLPSISIIESGGGKAAVNNNIFGWDGGRIVFKSIPHGIRTVAQVLSKSDLYRHKNTDDILRLYNPYPDYGFRVKAVMRSLGPVNVPGLAALD